MPNELLEKILLDEEVGSVPCGCQATMLNAIERIMKQSGYRIMKWSAEYDAIYEHES